MCPKSRLLKEKFLPVLVKDAVGGALEHIEARSKSREYLLGMATGLKELDTRTLGFQPGQLIACLARPSMGKTAFATSIMLNIARQKVPILYFSLNDISKEALVSRLISALGQVDFTHIRVGILNDSEQTKMVAGAGILSGLPIYIDTRVRSIQEIERLVKDYVKEYGVKFVVVDPLQCVGDITLLNGAERFRAYDMVCRRLKYLAKTCNIPIFLTAWLSRRFEENEKNRIVHLVSQLVHEEGNLESNADVVLQLYREEYYNPTPENRGIARISIIKGCSRGTADLRFCRDNGMSFENLEGGME